MADFARNFTAEMEQSLRLCVSTYINLYGVMPSTKEMCTQVGATNEVAVADFIRHMTLPSLRATA